MIKRYFINETTGQILSDGEIGKEQRKNLDKKLARMALFMAYEVEKRVLENDKTGKVEDAAG